MKRSRVPTGPKGMSATLWVSNHHAKRIRRKMKQAAKQARRSR